MNSTELFHLLIKTNPFEILDPDILDTLSAKMTVKAFEPNTYVFKQEDPSRDALFIIASGLVELTLIDDRGIETVVGLKRAYDFFGETVVLSRERYPASARVKEKLTCGLIRRRDLEELMYGYPEFCGFFNTLLAERLRLLYGEILAERSMEGFARIRGVDSSLFRKRVSEIMSYPVVTCRTDDSVTAASRIMDEKGINALVALDRSLRPRGILTEKNLVKYLIAQQTYPVETCRVENIMHSNLMAIKPQDFIGQALVAMMRSKTKHLIVLEREDPVGIISMTDLIRTQSAGTLVLTRDIESQPDINGLILVSREIQDILSAMVAENATVEEIFDVMSELYERLTRRVIQLSEERMKLDGWGPAPVEYCWINMGASARYEQAFGADQDNALIYADPEPEKAEAADEYFRRLADLIVKGLSRCGFSECARGVMATRAEWRRSRSDWLILIEEWLRSCDPGRTRMVLSLLDYRPIWGNMVLAESFRDRLFDAFAACLRSDYRVTRDDLAHRLPIRFLGTFQTEDSGLHKNEMNLKRSAILHIVNSIRMLAAKHRISEPSTLGRLKQLTESGAISRSDGDLFARSFKHLMRFCIRENLKKVQQGREPDNYIDPYSLRKRERVTLKDALSGVSRLLNLVKDEFDAFWLKQFT